MAAHFPSTEWSNLRTLHEGSTDEARAGLSRLCALYWLPLYCFLRRTGVSPEDAKELVQGFFVHLLEKDVLRGLDEAKGRFRSFLIASLKNFVANERRRTAALKRRPAASLIELDAFQAERMNDRLSSGELTPEEEYERNWAVAMIERAVKRLRAEQRSRGDEETFDRISPYVLGGSSLPPYRSMADSLGLSESALKVRVSRLRSRLGGALRDEVARTVADPAQVDDELRSLLTHWGGVTS